MKNTPAKALLKPSSSSGGKNTPNSSLLKSGSAATGLVNTVNFSDVDGFEAIPENIMINTLDESAIAAAAAAAAKQQAVLDKSFIMGETNITQMIKSLGNRTESLKSKMGMAKDLLRADVELSEEGNERGAKDLPKIVNDADEEVPRSLREIRMGNTMTGRKLILLLLVLHSVCVVYEFICFLFSITCIGDPAKMNLVTSENVFIDPYHLVLKTKAPTDAARKIEAIFVGASNNRDTKKQKTKGGVNADHAKKEEQVKSNSKRINRLRLERKLQQITETFVTRNVNDKIFQIPQFVDEDPQWAVTVKWSAKDPRASLPENAEGEFDPDLLLRYALEMIELPSGRKLFAWLIKQSVIQSYFVLLFWMIKVKFFETDNVDEKEVYILHKLSREYRKLVEMLAMRSHAEHEKDFVFKYLPFILANGVFYAFFYLFPGSRHSTNTKAFKKTVYMQVVQIMHGFQVCPISVKVSWAKLFPEDVHDAEALEDGEEGKEVFPVSFALKQPLPNKTLSAETQGRNPDSPKNKAQNNNETDPAAMGLRRSRSALTNINNNNDLTRSKSGLMALDSSSLDSLGDLSSTNTGTPSVVKRFQATSPAAGKGSALRFGLKKKGTMGTLPKLSRKGSSGNFSRTDSLTSGRLNRSMSLSLKGDEDLDYDDDEEEEAYEIDPFSEENITQTLAVLKSKPMLTRKPSVAKLAMQRTVSVAKINPPLPTSAINNHAASTGTLGIAGMSEDNNHNNNNSSNSSSSSHHNSHHHHHHGTNPPLDHHRPAASSTTSSGGQSEELPIPRPTSSSSHLFTTKHLSENPRYLRPLSKTHLKPPPAKPNNVATVKRQGVIDRISAQQVSPQMALLLSELKDSGSVDSNSTFSQTVRRTIPVNWCTAGGTDTHHRTVIATELHHEISEKLAKSRDDFKQSGSLAHHRKIKITENLNKELEKVGFFVFYFIVYV